MRKENPAPYPHTPPVHPSHFLQVKKTRSTEWQHQKQFLLIALSFFCCYNIRSTRFISVSASDLAIVHKRKPAMLTNGILLNAWQHNCIPRSCDYSVNVHHVQPLPLASSELYCTWTSLVPRPHPKKRGVQTLIRHVNFLKLTESHYLPLEMWISVGPRSMEIMRECIQQSSLRSCHNLPWLTKPIIQAIRHQTP